jgi:hypothetical protein
MEQRSSGPWLIWIWIWTIVTGRRNSCILMEERCPTGWGMMTGILKQGEWTVGGKSSILEGGFYSIGEPGSSSWVGGRTQY